MATKRILQTDGAGLVAHHWRAGRITVEAEFSNEPAGLEALSNYLKKHKSSLFYLLADIAEEGFQLEDLPYVQGNDRNALLQRRLSQYFYATPLSLAISLGRAKDGRRDEKILFAALTRVEIFTPWLDTLREAEAVFVGVYSVPLVLAQIGHQIVATEEPLLLLTLTRGGVRQSFFHNGKLHFSRLSQLATRSIEEIGRVCANDSAKIFQYLVAQRQLPRGTALRTVVLAGAPHIPTLREICDSSIDIHFDFVEIESTARKLGLKETLPDSNADRLLMHCLASKTPPQQFAAPSETRFHKLWKVKSALNSAAWTVLVACLLFSGKTALTVAELRDQTAIVKAGTSEDTRRYNTILESLPKIELSTDNLRILTNRQDVLQKRSPHLEPLLLHLSQALNENPRIELARLAWRITDSVETKGANAQTGLGMVVLDMEGQLPLVLVSDQRAQLELIEKFATRLRAANTTVTVLTRPFDIESNKPLRSASDSGTLGKDVPKFSLRVQRSL